MIAQDPHKVSGFADFKDFRLIKVEDMSLLGALIIDNQAMEVILKDKTHLLEKANSRLKELNRHDGLTILRNSLGIPKFQYILSKTKCTGRRELTEFDNTLRSGFVDILNVELTDTQ